MQNKISKHPCLTRSSDIQAICKPLQYLNINYFAHVHIDHFGKFTALGNNPKFSEHYLRNHYYNADIHLAKGNQFGQYVLWDAIKRSGLSEKMHIEAAQFGVQHTFTIIEKNNQGSNYYHFANHLSSTAINQVYLSNLDLLRQFILHFKEKVGESRNLSRAYKIKFNIDNNANGYTLKNDDDFKYCEKNRLYLQREIASNGVLTSSQTNHALPGSIQLLENLTQDFIAFQPTLSKRQNECLHYFILGMTMKEIGLKLKISPRTVEHHLEAIKEKFHAKTRSELIETILNKA